MSPEIRRVARERRLRAIDATCPLVTKVHLEAIKYASQGYTILLIGHEGHDEVIGTMGEAPEAILLVESPEDVDRLQVADESKLAYLTQTTLSVDDANRIIDRLKARFPQIAAPPKDDICYATQNRQEAVAQAGAARPQLTLVLGSQNSSNSQRLAELVGRARRAGASHRRAATTSTRRGSRASTRCWSPPGRAPRRSSSRMCSTTCASGSARRSRSRSLREENVSFPLPRELRHATVQLAPGQ